MTVNSELTSKRTASRRSLRRQNRWAGFKKFVAGASAAVLAGGTLVIAGLGVQPAAAVDPAPVVSVTEPDSYIWGEDLSLGISFTGTNAAGSFNVSAGVVLPSDVVVTGTGTLGTPITYAAGTVLPGVLTAAGIGDGTGDQTCVGLGLEAGPGLSCQVPVNTQYLVFQNISDLPDEATAAHSISIRPNADAYPLGANLNYQVNAFTNSNERYLPVFPGATGVNNSDAIAGTSSAGVTVNTIEVNALRITKSEVSHPENEVLRGVHGDHGAIFELRIRHTGESDLTDATVVDYLPAGLEYLGSCGLPTHNTSNANGTQGVDEYPDSGLLNTASVGTDCLPETSIETVQGSFDANGEFTETPGTGAVFTKVTWQLSTWEMSEGVQQGWPTSGAANSDNTTPGTPGETVIRYRAGVPLYENTMDFGGSTPDPGSLEQGANLDNNRGASTRHGTDDLSDEGGSATDPGVPTDAAANSYTEMMDIPRCRCDSLLHRHPRGLSFSGSVHRHRGQPAVPGGT